MVYHEVCLERISAFVLFYLKCDMLTMYLTKNNTSGANGMQKLLIEKKQQQ